MIQAPCEICFDLARSVDVHMVSTAQSKERAVAGVTSGLMELGDTVTWRARHFFIFQELTSQITRFDRPRHFRDSMVSGAFAWFNHDHQFEAMSYGTRMVDLMEYEAPYGLIGRVAEQLFLSRYLEGFLEERARVIKRLAESGEWRQWL